MNLTAHDEDIEFNKGDDIVFFFAADLCVDGTDTPIDISGWTVECEAILMQQDDDGNDVEIQNIAVTVVDDETRKIKIPKTETANDNRNYASYRIIVIDDDGDRRTHVRGQLKQQD